MPRTLQSALLVAIFAMILPSLASAQELKPFDDVPDIDIAHFFQGKEVGNFSKDKIYLLEFWATW